MRSFILVPLLSATALAWNSKICNGAGGCVGTTWNPDQPFRCPDGTRLNLQQTASNELDASRGAYDVVSKAEFPTSCLRGVKPGNADTLAVHKTEFGQKMYIFIAETCRETNPAADCYSAYPNPSSTTICQIVDTTGQNCAMAVNASQCEKWGPGLNGNNCK